MRGVPARLDQALQRRWTNREVGYDQTLTLLIWDASSSLRWPEWHLETLALASIQRKVLCISTSNAYAREGATDASLEGRRPQRWDS